VFGGCVLAGIFGFPLSVYSSVCRQTKRRLGGEKEEEEQEDEIFKIKIIENRVTSCSLFVQLGLAGNPLGRYTVKGLTSSSGCNS
jgi:hypothetical protein